MLAKCSPGGIEPGNNRTLDARVKQFRCHNGRLLESADSPLLDLAWKTKPGSSAVLVTFAGFHAPFRLADLFVVAVVIGTTQAVVGAACHKNEDGEKEDNKAKV
jgi:hypothetical protein